MEKKSLPLRSEVPLHETWNLESVFPDVQSWEEAKDQVDKHIPELAAFKGKLSQSAAILAEFMDLYETTMRLSSKVMVYGMLASSVDTSDQQAQAMAGQGQSLIVRLNAATSFMYPELMQIGFEQLRAWTLADPHLSHLDHFIDELERQKAHVRSDEVEQVLALSGEPLGVFFRAYNAITNADLTFDDAVDKDGNAMEVGQSSINSLITHADRRVRQTGFENYAKGYLDFKNTLASLQIGGIHRDVFNARTRNYPSSLQAALDTINIPSTVFYALIDTFQNNLPIWHRYWRVRKKALALESFHVYDIKAPLSSKSPQIPFEQAIAWICEGMAPLGEEIYPNNAERGLRRPLGRSSIKQRQTAGRLLWRCL